MPNDKARARHIRSLKPKTSKERRERLEEKREKEYWEWKKKRFGPYERRPVSQWDWSSAHSYRTPRKGEDESAKQWLKRQLIEKSKMASNVLAGWPASYDDDKYYRELYSEERKGAQKKMSGGRVIRSIDGKAIKGLTRGSGRT